MSRPSSSQIAPYRNWWPLTMYFWSGRGDSNSRSPAPKAGALATTLRPEAQGRSLNQISHSDYRPSTFSPYTRGCSSMVEPQPSKLAMPVRSRSPAPDCLSDRPDLVNEGSASEKHGAWTGCILNGNSNSKNCSWSYSAGHSN